MCWLCGSRYMEEELTAKSWFFQLKMPLMFILGGLKSQENKREEGFRTCLYGRTDVLGNLLEMPFTEPKPQKFHSAIASLFRELLVHPTQKRLRVTRFLRGDLQSLTARYNLLLRLSARRFHDAALASHLLMRSDRLGFS